MIKYRVLLHTPDKGEFFTLWLEAHNIKHAESQAKNLSQGCYVDKIQEDVNGRRPADEGYQFKNNLDYSDYDY